ncbi:MAG: hypothetical protein U9N45_02350 [Gemmatimonadota bacterium]|nr:hypothetical protein [Gemmatimonadota bacterium]
MKYFLTGISPGKFSRTFILVTLVLLTLVLGLNIVVNPYGLYSTSWLNPVVWSDRKEKIKLLEDYPDRIELLIMGSSRMMRIDPRLLGSLASLECFNLSVNHARTEDFLALLRYSVISQGLHLKSVIIGLDINAFRGLYQMDNLLKYYPELFHFTSSEKQTFLNEYVTLNWNKFNKGLSFHQLEKSLTALGQLVIHGPWENTYNFSSNGMMIYNRLEDNPAPDGSLALEEKLNAAIERYRREYGGIDRLSEERKNYFFQTIEFCRRHGIELVVVTLPYHPRFFKSLEGSPFTGLNSRWEEFLTETAGKYGFKLVECQNLESFGGDASSFYDEIHMKQSNSDLLIRYLVREAGFRGGKDTF